MNRFDDRARTALRAWLLATALLGGCVHAGGKEDLELFEKSFDETLVIATTELPRAVTGREYRFTLRAQGQPKPYTWRLAGGQLPDGLQLDQEGVIAGTPVAPGTATFVVKVSGPLRFGSSRTGSHPHVGERWGQLKLKVLGASPRDNPGGPTVAPAPQGQP
jgi:hypothetical protein